MINKSAQYKKRKWKQVLKDKALDFASLLVITVFLLLFIGTAYALMSNILYLVGIGK